MIVLIEALSSQVGMYVPAYPLPLMEVAAFAAHRVPAARFEILHPPSEYGLPVDREGARRVFRRLVQDLADRRPAAVGISCTAIAQSAAAMELCQRIRERLPAVLVFMGGYFPSHYPGELLARCPALDLVVVGEGEDALAGIAAALAEGRDPRDPEIPNLAWRSKGQVRFSPGRRFDLRRRVPLRPELLRSNDAFEVLPYAFSRGCPYRCSFCMEPALRPRRQPTPAGQVAEDLDRLTAGRPLRTLLVSDALFTSFEQVDRIRRLGLRMNFEARCDTLDPDLLAGIADAAGIVALGLESASYDTLRRMNKVRDRAHHRRYLAGAEAIFRTAAAAGIPLMVFMIAGFPGDREADLAASLEFARHLSDLAGPAGHVFKVGECHVYPGTGTERLARRLPGVEFDDDGVFGHNVVRRPSAGLDFDTVTACIREIYSLSRPGRTLQRRLLRLMPFFRLPARALADPLVPDGCYRDGGRHLLDVRPPALAAFRRIAGRLQERYRGQRSGDRGGRRLAIGAPATGCPPIEVRE